MQVEDSLVHWHPCVYCLGRNPLRLKLELAATAMGSGVCAQRRPLEEVWPNSRSLGKTNIYYRLRACQKDSLPTCVALLLNAAARASHFHVARQPQTSPEYPKERRPKPSRPLLTVDLCRLRAATALIPKVFTTRSAKS